ncbi:MAG TPA: helix-turn-helix domain-containing protein [Novosphingobium sp.]|nr:helix-turn-helix domain-containing protein [Novosphingobium sp.]
MAEQISDGINSLKLEPLTEMLGFLTRVVQIQINDIVRGTEALTISPAVLAVLQLVGANPGIRQVQVARVLLIQESNLASLVKRLIADKLIERRGTPGGKRGGLWLTGGGTRLVDGAASLEHVLEDYLEVLSDDERRRLIDMLNRLYRAAL